MADLRLSRRASDEIYEEAERLGAFSPSYAKAFIDAVFVKIDLLRRFPELGRAVPEYGNPAIREVFYRHYRIFYFVGPGEHHVGAIEPLPAATATIETARLKHQAGRFYCSGCSPGALHVELNSLGQRQLGGVVDGNMGPMGAA